jgi:rhamnosyltransferase
MFDTGVFHAQNPWLLTHFGRAEGEGWRLLCHQWSALQTHAHGHIVQRLKGLVQIVFTNGVKLCGYKLGQLHRFWPRALNQRFSMYKSYWRQQA